MARAVTQEEAVRRIRAALGDKYDLSKVEYVRQTSEVTVSCKLHGDFTKKPEMLWQGAGCKLCSREQRGLTTEGLIIRLVQVFGDKYDYNNVLYTGWDGLVTLGCPEHGTFEKSAQYLVKGIGCNRCSPPSTKGLRRIPAATWVSRFKEAHGDKYDYSKVKLSADTTKVIVTCREHGDFAVDPFQLAAGHECKSCSTKKVTIPVETWIERFRSVHGDKYDYTKITTVTESKKIIIVCPTHGEFVKSHYDHWKVKSGCKDCLRPKKAPQPRKNHLWTEADNDHVRNAFPTMPRDAVLSGLSAPLTWPKVAARASKLGVTRKRQLDMNWTTSDGRKMTSYTDEEVEYLISSYSTKPKEEIMSHLGRSWRAVCTKARQLGLTRPNIRTHQLAPLLDFSNIKNSYWLGFIMADGFISTKGDLKVSLNEKDRAHLVALSEHIGGGHQITSQAQGTMASLCAMDKINGVALREALGITEVKTYNPPASLSFLRDKDHRLAFALGFSDGDGSVHFDHNGTFKSLRIIIHGSWYELFKGFFAQLSVDFDELNFTVNNTNARGNTSIYIGTKATYKFITHFGELHDLPLMKRKWVSPLVRL